MLQTFYQLREQPFGVNPDPRFLYLSRTHREAFSSLLYRIRTDSGFLAMIAEPGMGKTTLLFHLLHKLQGTAKTAFIFQTQCSSNELLRQLLSEFECDTSITDPVRISQELKSLLLAEANAGRRCVLIVDEAQNLGPEVLETIRLLSNFETPRRKLLNIILSGQGELGEMLASSNLRQLRQRLSCITYLQRFTPGETALYIAHRLAAAGYPGKVSDLFSLHALTRIAQLSEGIPRVINNICFNALSLGYALEASQIDSAMIEEVAGDLGMSGRHRPLTSESANADRLAEAREIPAEAVVRSVEEVKEALSTIPPARAHEEPAPLAPPVSPLPEIAAKAPEPDNKELLARSGEKVLAVINEVRKWPEEIAERLQNFKVSAEATPEPTATPLPVEAPSGPPKKEPGSSSANPHGTRKRKTGLYVTGGSAGLLALCLVPAMRFSAHVSAHPAKEPAVVTIANTHQGEGIAPNADPSLQVAVASTAKANTPDISKPVSADGAESASSQTPAAAKRIEQFRQGKKMLVNLALASFAPEPLMELSPLRPMPVAARSSLGENSSSSAGSPAQIPSGVKQKSQQAAYVPPKAIWQPTPQYPANVRRRNPKADNVQLLLSISNSGEVETVDVLNGNSTLAEAAEKTVKTWKYSPALSNGNPVKSQAYITVQFQ